MLLADRARVLRDIPVGPVVWRDFTDQEGQLRRYHGRRVRLQDAVLPSSSHGWEPGDDTDEGKLRKGDSTFAWRRSHAGCRVREGNPTQKCLRRDNSRLDLENVPLREIFRRRKGTSRSPSRWTQMNLVIIFRQLCGRSSLAIVCVCVCVCVLLPIYSGRQACGRTSPGHTGGRSHRISHPPSFCGACLNFSREQDSAVPFPRRP